MSYVITEPYQFIAGLDGEALDAGYIYYGQPNLDPMQYPKAVYTDEAMTIPAVQPLRTTNGYIVRNGSPTALFTDGNYSVTVLDKFQRQIYHVPDFMLLGNAVPLTRNQVTFPVATIAALRALDKTQYSYAMVAGYYAHGDGGGGLYYFDAADITSVDNGGTIIVATDGARWKLAQNDSVSVKQFGAKGDGVTNDYAAIQAAIDTPTVRRLRIPAGYYVIKSCLNLTERGSKPLTIVGDSAHVSSSLSELDSCIIGQTGTWMADFTGSMFQVVEDVRFLSTGTGASTNGLLYARSPTNNFAMYNQLHRVVVVLPTNISATTIGSVAVLNNTAEHFDCEDCWFIADTPLAITYENDVGVSSVYTTISNTNKSSTAMNFRLCTFQPLAYSAVSMWGCATIDFDTCIYIPSGAGYLYGIQLHTSGGGTAPCQNINLTGQMESFTYAVRMDGNTNCIKSRLSLVNITSAHFSLFSGTSHFGLENRNHTGNGAQQLVAASGPGVTLIGGYQYLGPTAKFVDGNVTLQGTIVDGGNNDMGNAANFNVHAASSYRALWSFDWFHFFNVYNPGSVSSGSSVGTTFAASGVAIGDKVTVYPPYDLSGAIVQACVSSAGNIRLTIANLTGSTLSFGSGTWKYAVERATF